MPRGSGRRPKPTALRKLEGNRGKRALNASEPQPRAGEPPMPAYLSEIERAYWQQIVPQLLSLKVLTQIDGSALAGCCMAYGEMIEARAEAKRFALAARTELPFATLRERALSRADRAAKRWKSFLIEFGMTPASRSRLSTSDPDAGQSKDPADAYFSGEAERSGQAVQ